MRTCMYVCVRMCPYLCTWTDQNSFQALCISLSPTNKCATPQKLEIIAIGPGGVHDVVHMSAENTSTVLAVTKELLTRNPLTTLKPSDLVVTCRGESIPLRTTLKGNQIQNGSILTFKLRAPLLGGAPVSFEVISQLW